jgi:hypothetical protein
MANTNINSIGLLAIFRNEAHILEEFIEHYKFQGIDHFYLINNASTDNYLEILEKYSDIVTLKQEPYVGPTKILEFGGRQLDVYNEILPEISTEWLFVCDLDEFAYTREYKNIKEFLKVWKNKFEQILIPLKTFNSSGLLEQPDNVVNSFTNRRANEKYMLYKPLVRRDCINKIKINYCTLNRGTTTNGSLSLFSDAFVTDEPRVDNLTALNFRHVGDGKLEQSKIIANHYTTQSREWFYRVKATRGTATWHGGPKMEATEWFTKMWDRAHQQPTVDDYELKELNVINRVL